MPILFVLLNTFKYTTMKLATYRSRASEFVTKPYPWYTPFAENIWLINLNLMKQCQITFNVGEKTKVKEHNMTFEVDVSNLSNVTCSCRQHKDKRHSVPSKKRINQCSWIRKQRRTVYKQIYPLAPRISLIQ